MRLQERIKLDDKEYTINELTVEEIIGLFSRTEQSIEGSNQTTEEKTEEIAVLAAFSSLFANGGVVMKSFMDLAMPGTSLQDLIKLAPSELAEIMEAMKRVNKYFFDLAQKLELGNLLLGAVKEVLQSFSEYAVALSKEAIEES